MKKQENQKLQVDIEDLKNKLFKVSKDLETEKERSGKLETFIRNVALKP